MKSVNVDVGIPAYNEEANIQRLLESIRSQVSNIVRIKTIYLISDGSNDRTVSIAKSLKLKNLVIHDAKKRKGKSARMAELFRLATTDFLIMLDADVVLANEYVLEKICEPLVSARATLTSGHPIKINATSFADHVMDVSQYLQDYVKTRYRGGNSVYSCHGRIVGLHRKLFETLKLPFSTVGNDAYLYYSNLDKEGTFEYCPDADVLYKMPQSFKDFQKQKKRFVNTNEEQDNIFGSRLTNEYAIPLKLKAAAFVTALLKYHLYTVVYLIWKAWPTSKQAAKVTAAWEMSRSTKSLE